MRGALLAFLLLAAPAVIPPAQAQVESREGIMLQNQILQLRQEMEMLRRGGVAAPVAPPPVARGGGGGGSELIGPLLDRVNALEEEVRRLRGQAEQADYRLRNLQQVVEKLQGDMDYRLQQLEAGRAGGGAPATPPPARPAAPAASPVPTPAPAQAAPAPRTPERALSDGQAALGRRDYPAAEAAAREALATRNSPRTQDAQLLLGEALLGRRDFQNAALAFDDAYRRNRQSSRAPEALVGLASAFNGFGARREACQTLDDLRSQFPRLSGGLNDRATRARQQAGCR
ncbi:hypothetical protein LPC08_15705 [Roseomonas sp. OT10]|uniref:YbgF trimerization domain-containing protein n=1 Tax=Roseomonas cutis TaxID=2897332 RepID=UPI001E5A1FD8|nr:tetratricopeptide repeat protein [Roseomonas sp. OT10]UFN47456.1 hypothetical protein LPC08_15705 [Roseomonas sp. OT10]